MICNTSYDTTIGKVVNITPIQHAVEKAFITSELANINLNVSVDGEYKACFVTGATESDKTIPLFTHPILVFNSKATKYLVSDLRLYLTQNPDISNLENSIKNRTEYNFAKSRAILNLLWLNGEISSIKNNLNYAGVVYSAWLAESIAKTYALDFNDRTIVNIVATAYYYTLFNKDEEIKDNDKLIAWVIKNTKLPAAVVIQVIDQITEMKDIADFCSVLTKVVTNVRLQEFNLAVLLTIVTNSWYGNNAKEIISVALEHPPTWIALVYTCLSERSYKTTKIYNIAERYGKRGVSDDFVQAFISMMSDSISKENKSIFKPFE